MEQKKNNKEIVPYIYKDILTDETIDMDNMKKLVSGESKDKILEYIESGEYAKDLFSDDNMVKMAYAIKSEGIGLIRKNLEEIGFVYVEKGTKLQNGDEYTNDEFVTYELGEFCPTTDYTILTVHDNGYIGLLSNIHWVGDPAMMGQVFSGKNVKTMEELEKLLYQIGITEKE